MTEQEKIDAVRSYLEDRFPGYTVYDSHDHDLGHSFRIRHASVSYLATVTEEFFEDYPAEEISELLHRFRLADTLRRMGGEKITVKNDGLQADLRPR